MGLSSSSPKKSSECRDLLLLSCGTYLVFLYRSLSGDSIFRFDRHLSGLPLGPVEMQPRGPFIPFSKLAPLRTISPGTDYRLQSTSRRTHPSWLPRCKMADQVRCH